MGTITSWNWNFGDGASSSIQNPIHTYTYEGKYIVSLTVSGPYGSDKISKDDYISIAGISNRNEYKMLPSDYSLNRAFGESVSISGGYAIVGTGAYHYGAVYIFDSFP
jgi:PKD repeat protein